MIFTHLLTLPDFSKPFIVEVNACGTGVGVVLLQNKQVVAYLNQVLSKKYQGLSTYEKRVDSLIDTFDKWRHYLHPNHFIIRTNHLSLKFLRTKKSLPLFSSKD